MSSRFRIAMGGVSEPIGLHLMQAARRQPMIRLVALTLGEVEIPPGSRMEVFIADVDRWVRVMRAMKPRVFIIGLGPPANLIGKDSSALRAIDEEESVVEIAKTARFAGVERLIAISSDGADRWSRDKHLSAKGKAETELARLGFKRLDIVRPCPLSQSVGFDGSKRSVMPALRGRGTDVGVLAEALLALSLRRTPGKFVHDEQGIERAATMLTRAPAARDEGTRPAAEQQAEQG